MINYAVILKFDKKTNYVINYELLRDNQQNYKMFEIKTISLPINPVNTLFKDNVNEVKVSYLSFKGENIQDLLSELYYRNSEGKSYADVDEHKKDPWLRDLNGKLIKNKDKLILDKVYTNYPIFKNKKGKREMLPKDLQLNPDKIVRYLNIKANILIVADNIDDTAEETYYNETSTIDAGYFESNVAITTNHNLSLLFTDFWKHGQGGIIDITDKIYPTYWYGQQHPFEFECIVAEDPSVHKIFTNLELIANKTKPESFHYEVVGDIYDFADDKPTMYFRQEALKALYQYNGYDIEYNPNFLEIEPKQHNRSADLPKYYSRWDTINEIYDSYKRFSAPEGSGLNYDHLAGAEIVYYSTRNEFRVWNHVEAIDVDSLSQELATSVIKANCRYLEDKWLISINPIVVTYKNEIGSNVNELFEEIETQGSGKFIKNKYGVYKYSTWVKSYNNDSLLPPISILETKMKESENGKLIEFPGEHNSEIGKDNALYQVYDLSLWNQGDWKPIDPYKNKDRRETDVRGKFMKVRIRYSGEELAIIDFLNTIYQISFA